MDVDGGAFGDGAAVDQTFAGLRPAEILIGGETETQIELTLVTGAEPDQCAIDALDADVADPEPAEDGAHLFTFNTMQNKRFVRIVIWIVVVSMVIGLGFTVFALLS